MLQKDSAEMSRVSKFVIAQVGNPANFLNLLLFNIFVSNFGSRANQGGKLNSRISGLA